MNAAKMIREDYLQQNAFDEGRYLYLFQQTGGLVDQHFDL